MNKARANAIGGAAVIATVTLLVLFRNTYVEPRVWSAACAATDAPWICTPRDWLLWMQYQGYWGAAALAIGLWAFFGAPFAIRVAAVALGAAAAINYNATYGLLGAALGAWAWMTQRSSGGAASTKAHNVHTSA